MEETLELLRRLQRRQSDGAYNTLHGIQIVSCTQPGLVQVKMPANKHILNPLGNVHGGAIFTLCDVTAGTAAASHGRVGVTLHGDINYLLPGYPDIDLVATSTELKYGKTTAVYLIEVFQKERRIACAQFTMFYTGQLLKEYKDEP